MTSRYDDAPLLERKAWGSELEWRPREIARLLSGVANSLQPLMFRKVDAENLAAFLSISPHRAWMLAQSAAVRLGFEEQHRHRFRQLAERRYPGGEYPTALAWLTEADLYDDGSPKAPDLDPEDRRFV